MLAFLVKLSIVCDENSLETGQNGLCPDQLIQSHLCYPPRVCMNFKVASNFLLFIRVNTGEFDVYVVISST